MKAEIDKEEAEVEGEITAKEISTEAEVVEEMKKKIVVIQGEPFM